MVQRLCVGVRVVCVPYVRWEGLLKSFKIQRSPPGKKHIDREKLHQLLLTARYYWTGAYSLDSSRVAALAAALWFQMQIKIKKAERVHSESEHVSFGRQSSTPCSREETVFPCLSNRSKIVMDQNTYRSERLNHKACKVHLSAYPCLERRTLRHTPCQSWKHHEVLVCQFKTHEHIEPWVLKCINHTPFLERNYPEVSQIQPTSIS